jgi:hypothetical protein
VSEEPVSLIIAKIREILEKALGELDATERRWKEMPPDAKLDADRLEALPWTNYRTGGGSWLLWERVEDAKPLKEALEKAPNRTLVFGEFRYKLQGDRLQFLSKFPVSKR